MTPVQKLSYYRECIEKNIILRRKACAIHGAKYGFNAISDEYVNGLIYKK